jgi:hypothetical protein
MFAEEAPVTIDHPIAEAPEDPLFSDLLAGDIHDAKTKFDLFMSQLDILPYLTVTRTRIHSYARHCPSLLTKVGNGNWTTEPAVKNSDGRYTITDPLRFYDVHMEIAVKPGLYALEVLVHHETSPFLPEDKLRSLFDRDAADQYRRHRNEFREEFERQCGIAGFTMANRWMLVGKADYSYKGKSVSRVSEWLARTIDDITDVINWTMNKLDARTRFCAQCEVETAPGLVSEDPEETPDDEDSTASPIESDLGPGDDSEMTDRFGTTGIIEEDDGEANRGSTLAHFLESEAVPFPEDEAPFPPAA